MTSEPGKQSTTQSFAMADVSGKAVTRRRALARGSIHVGETAFGMLQSGSLPKGDALAMAEIAGIQAAKATPSLLPLCHPIALSRVAVQTVLEPAGHRVAVYALAEISERTGVEMEALTGASVALLTLWDLVKPINPALEISGVTLLYKSGGKKGEWIHPDGLDPAAREILKLD
jgi:molybdenum cofactor biosynthesis protein MoaC